MWGAEVAEPLRMAQGSLAKLGFGFLGPRLSQKLQPQQLKLKCHQSREFLMDPPCSQSTWDLHPSPQSHKESKPAPFGVPAVLSHIHTRNYFTFWVQSRVWQTQQMLCPVSDRSGVSLSPEREIKPLWLPSSPCSYGKCAAQLPKPRTVLLTRRIWLKYLPRKKQC